MPNEPKDAVDESPLDKALDICRALPGGEGVAFMPGHCALAMLAEIGRLRHLVSDLDRVVEEQRDEAEDLYDEIARLRFRPTREQAFRAMKCGKLRGACQGDHATLGDCLDAAMREEAK